jgi:hypothetical protein
MLFVCSYFNDLILPLTLKGYTQGIMVYDAFKNVLAFYYTNQTYQEIYTFNAQVCFDYFVLVSLMFPLVGFLRSILAVYLFFFFSLCSRLFTG